MKTILAAAGLALCMAAAPALADDKLHVCLDENTAPLSSHHGKAEGFDLALADAVAKRLGRTLDVQWFEIELDEDSSLTLQANALLSDGHCDLVASYPMVRGALGKPKVETARLPNYEGNKPEDRRRRIPLGALIPSKPYYFSALTVVLGGKTEPMPVKTLADLQGMKLGALEGTLADAILMTYSNRRLADHVAHVVPGPRGHLFERLDQGEFDATLVVLRSFDAYRDAHPDTKIKASGFYHRVGFNMGFVALDRDAKLIDQVNAVLGDLQAKNELPAMAQAAGMTYLPPHQPEITEMISIVDLYSE